MIGSRGAMAENISNLVFVRRYFEGNSREYVIFCLDSHVHLSMKMGNINLGRTSHMFLSVGYWHFRTNIALLQIVNNAHMMLRNDVGS